MDDSSGGGFFGSLQDPQTYGLLAAGLGILANANGPNSRNAIGAGALTGLQAAQAAQQNAYLGDYRKAQAAKLQQDAEKNRVVLDILGKVGGQSQPGALLAGAMPPNSPSAMPSGGPQGFPLSLQDVTALKLAGVDVFDQYKYANDGVKRDPGAFYDNPVTGQREYIPKVPEGFNLQMGADGKPTIAPIAGYLQGTATQAGATTDAQEAAKAKYDLVAVPLPGGGTQLMPRAQAAALLGSESAGRPSEAAGGAASGSAAGLGTAPSAQVVAARAELPKLDTQITQLTSTIDKALVHPGLKYSVGPWSVAPTIPGTDQADFRAIQGQLQGQAFLQAYQSLRGGGAITEVEGQKAENAIARLNSAQSEGAYREALGDLKSVLSAARERAYKQAGLDIPSADSKEAGSSAGGARKVTRRGTYNGRPVVQYSDGTVEYQ
jgi:hypothetical protein